MHVPTNLLNPPLKFSRSATVQLLLLEFLSEQEQSLRVSSSVGSVAARTGNKTQQECLNDVEHADHLRDLLLPRNP